MFLVFFAFGKTGFFQTKDEGWHFYHDEVPAAEEKKSKPKNMVELRKQVQECLEAAVFTPTLTNIRRYQYMQKQVIERSQLFANRWAQSLIEDPELDHTVKVPASYYGTLAYKKRLQEKRNHIILAGKETYALFLFVGQGDDYASKALFDVVSRWAEYRGYILNVLTEDSHCTLPQAVSDQGLATAWGIKRYPGLVLQHIASGRRGIITYGLLAGDAIEERMVSLMEAWS